MNKIYLSLLIILTISTLFVLISETQHQNIQKNKVDPKVPLYLSVETNNDTSKPIIWEFLSDNFINCLEAFPTAQKKMLKDFDDVEMVFKTDKKQGKWQFPNSWHTTLLYMGNNPEELLNPIYLDFKPGVDVTLESRTFVYLPGKIMCSPDFLPPDIKSSNNVTHVTLMQGELSPVYCNDVLEATFYNENAPLKQYYSQLQDENLEIIQHIEIIVDDIPTEAFIVKVSVSDSKQYIPAQFVLEGETEAVYSI